MNTRPSTIAGDADVASGVGKYHFGTNVGAEVVVSVEQPSRCANDRAASWPNIRHSHFMGSRRACALGATTAAIAATTAATRNALLSTASVRRLDRRYS